MKKGAFKIVLAICTIFFMCLVLVVGQAQATLIEPGPGLYDEGWSFLVEYDDTVFKQVEGISQDKFFNIFKIDFADKTTANISWDLSPLGDNAILKAISMKAGNATWHWLVDTDQQVIGSGTIVSPNIQYGISDIRFSVPDASIMLLLGPAFIGLGLLGRRKYKRS